MVRPTAAPPLSSRTRGPGGSARPTGDARPPTVRACAPSGSTAGPPAGPRRWASCLVLGGPPAC
eukprot:7321170-Alexandrium_andersonii.AAC.1